VTIHVSKNAKAAYEAASRPATEATGGIYGNLSVLPHSVKDQEKCSPRVNRASDGFLPSLVMGLRIKAFLDGEKLE
jgi:hypothetical protein